MRSDLGPGLQAAQAVHAAFEFATQHPTECAKWYRDSNFVVIVSVPTEDDLYHLIEKADTKGVEHFGVREPDLDDSITAVAFTPSDQTRRFCSYLPLAMKT